VSRIHQSTIIFVMIIGFVSTSFAFDGNRKGFILGIGAGLGTTKIDSWAGNTSKTPIFTNFKIGGGFTDQLEIYYSSKVSWFKFDHPWYINGARPLYTNEEVTAAHGIGAIGVTYAFAPKIPTFYGTVGYGFSTFSFPFEADLAEDAAMGSGFYLGGGYEFSKHYSVELDFLFGKPTVDGDQDSEYDCSSIMLTINALAY